MKDKDLEKLKALSKQELEEMSDDRYRARLINCLSGIKTAVLVGSVSGEGQTNLAVFSSLFHLGANPALMGLIFRPHVTERHTLENIQNIGHFTINILPSEFSKNVHHTSARFTKEQSEFATCGFNELWRPDIRVPFVKEAPISWHLSYVRTYDIPENGTHMVIGAVENIFVPESILKDDGFLDIESVDPCLVSGLDCYHQVKGKRRYSYAKPDHGPNEIL
jgi:flavin reductase (DIM6/NTAB) family NADH-FMN oxidoreductase RutF